MNGRVCDSATGRFISADPNVPYAEDIQSYNRYSYTRNNPLNLVGPSGFEDIYSIVNGGGYGNGTITSSTNTYQLNIASTYQINSAFPIQIGSVIASVLKTMGYSFNVKTLGTTQIVAPNGGAATGAAIAGAAWQAHEAASVKALSDAGYQIAQQVRVTWAGAEGSYALMDAIATKPVGEGLNIVMLEAKDGLTSKLSSAQKQLFKAAFSSGGLMLTSSTDAATLGLKASSSLAKKGALYDSVDASVMGSRSLGQFARIAAGSARMGGFVNPSVIYGGLRRMLPSLAVFEILIHHQSTGGCDRSGKCSDMVDWSKREAQKKE